MINKQQLLQRCGMKVLRIAAFLFAVVLMQTTANAQVETGKQYPIIALHSDKCVDVSGGLILNGQAIIQWDCKQSDNQKWEFVPNNGFYEIKAGHSKKCLDVEGFKTENGTLVQQWVCHGGQNQLWTLKQIGDGYQIQSAQSGKCLSVSGSGLDRGVRTQILDCGDARQKNQIFKIAPIPVARYTYEEQRCYNMAHDKIAFDRAGNKRWNENDLRALCKETAFPVKTVECFITKLNAHGDRQRATSECSAEEFRVNPPKPGTDGAGQPESLDKPSSLNPREFSLLDEKTSPLNETEMDAVMKWIANKVAADRLPYCYKNDSYFRGDPISLSNYCADGLERSGAYCYPKCKNGYAGNGPLCFGTCPSGFEDVAAICQKPKTQYGRGAGYPLHFGEFNLNGARTRCEKDNPQGCEQNLAVIYPKCKPGFHAVGCCICSPSCPSGYTDTGTGCGKPSYGRGVGVTAVCPAGYEQEGLSCFKPCNAGYKGIERNCFKQCPSNLQAVDCGLGCATTKKDCALVTASQVYTPILAAVGLGTLLSAAPATTAANASVGTATNAAKAASHLDKLKNLYAAMKPAIEQAKLAFGVYTTVKSINNERDLYAAEVAAHFSVTTSPEIEAEIDKRFGRIAAWEIKRRWGMAHLAMMSQVNSNVKFKDAMAILSVVDITGLIAVENAYFHPKCKDDAPFPTVKPLYAN